MSHGNDHGSHQKSSDAPPVAGHPLRSTFEQNKATVYTFALITTFIVALAILLLSFQTARQMIMPNFSVLGSETQK